MGSFPYRGQPILSKALFALYGSSYGDYNRECKEIKKERHRKDMKKVVLFFILNQFADWEAAYLSSALRSLGKDRYIVKTVSLTKDKVQSIGGFQILPDYDISSMPEEYEALILIGGMTWRETDTTQIGKMVEKASEQGKIIGGICDASAFLGTTGILNKVNHTSNELEEIKEWAKDAYTGESRYIRKQAVRDGRIVTANGTASLEFSREVLFALEAAPENEIMDWYRFHKLGYYEASVPDM